MTTQEIVSKLWNLCNVLRDDGITYHQCLINPLYLMHIVQSPQIQKWLTDNSKGTAQKGIYLNALSLMIIPIPPLAEQARIVEHIHIAYKQLDLISNALI